MAKRFTPNSGVILLQINSTFPLNVSDRSPFLIVVLLVSFFILPAVSTATIADFSDIKSRLEADGVPDATIQAYFSDDRFELLPSLLKINVKQPDARNAYKGFVQRESVNLTSSYLSKHLCELQDFS